jgi:ATP-binding cassette, subfamily B (MDR/TAP), member 1
MAEAPPSPPDDGIKEPESKNLERTPAFTDYLRVFGYATKWDFVVYAFAIVASLGAGITMPLMVIVLGQLSAQFTDFARESSLVTVDAFNELLTKQSLILLGLFLGRWTLGAINKFCFRMIGIRLSSAIRRHYLETLFAQSIHVIDSMPTGAPATAITTTANTLQLGISERLGTLLQFNATIWGSLIVAFIWSWELTLVAASLMLYIILVLAVCLPFIIKGQTETIQADAQGTAIASESLEGVRLVMACGAQGRVISRYKKWIQQAMKKGQKVAPVVGAELGLYVCSTHFLTSLKLRLADDMHSSLAYSGRSD